MVLNAFHGTTKSYIKRPGDKVGCNVYYIYGYAACVCISYQGGIPQSRINSSTNPSLKIRVGNPNPESAQFWNPESESVF